MLVGIQGPDLDRWDVLDSLEELGELVRSAGAVVAETVAVRLERVSPSLFIGRGKASEIAGTCRRLGISVAVFDRELSPVQRRNLERVFGIKVLDRTEIVLDIFAQRARTKAGQLQIELAQLEYLLPRLTRLWSHLSRQQGGIGTRGPGETQLEVDRRRIQERIATLRRRLGDVRKRRRAARSSRRRKGYAVAALVGYTNAGKSTLLNALTAAGVDAEDKLFATLDPTTRILHTTGNQPVLLTDTVGFLRRLPAHLVEAFHATLEEVTEADLLLHVVDISHPRVDEQIAAVEAVLGDLGAGSSPRITVYNKVDRLNGSPVPRRYMEKFPSSVVISAREKSGLKELVEELDERLRTRRVHVHLRIPASDGASIARLHEEGHVLTERYAGDVAVVEALVPRAGLGRWDGYLCDAASAESSPASGVSTELPGNGSGTATPG
jgi:GTP-binding protein HflX